ncbi:MAG: methionine biosynthesis protein MetW [Propionibacteriaceae bacterium]|jgi:methionine biosynthesis protein MetW|nr:methionine biosynthesis protein MetW [Propionibacteriaceae bacterium]
MTTRADFRLIASWIAPGTRVIDLGCGGGQLLKSLAETKGCHIQGVEVDAVSHLAAVRRGVPVIQMDIDKELDLFRDLSYDVAILSKTLQAVRYPAVVLRHMMRIAPVGIVSMPNFAYWKNRARLLAGWAPVSKDLPYAWHDSPNVHFGSSADLEALFADMNLEITRCVPLSATGRISRAPLATRNWSAGAVLYRLGAGS